MAQDAQIVLGGRQFPVVVIACLCSRGDEKKVGSEKGPANRRISPKIGIPQTTSAGLCLGPWRCPRTTVPLSLDSHDSQPTGEGKSGQLSPTVAALDMTRLHRSSLGTGGFLVHGRES